MSNYKNILIGYINQSERGGEYLKITNVSDEPITIEPEGVVCLNKTPDDIKQKYPKTPHFKKSVKLEEQKRQPDPDSPTYELRNDGSIKGTVDPDSIPF